MSSSGEEPIRSHGPGPTGGSAVGRERPREVDVSFWLWIASVVIALISTALSLLQLDTLRAASLEAASQGGAVLDPAAAEQAANIGVIVGVVVALLLVVAQLALALLMRRGRNWARIVLAVLAALTVLLLPLSVPTSTGPILAVTVIQTLLVLVATVYMFLPRANPWFRSAGR